MTRLGRSNDGGYVLPAHVVLRAEYLLSFGLALDWEFERQFDALTALTAVHCYDHSVTKAEVFRIGAVAALKAAIGSVPRKRLGRMKLALSYFRFFGKGHVRHFQLAVRRRDTDGARSFESALCSLAASSGNIFLKCDIEGGEYEIADQIKENFPSLSGMVIEFHDIIAAPERFYSTLDILLELFTIVHIHANNCARVSDAGLADVLEISFVSRSVAEGVRGLQPNETMRDWRLASDPRQLDAPNTTAADDIELRYE